MLPPLAQKRNVRVEIARSNFRVMPTGASEAVPCCAAARAGILSSVPAVAFRSLLSSGTMLRRPSTYHPTARGRLFPHRVREFFARKKTGGDSLKLTHGTQRHMGCHFC